jgi:hypothetical protein
MNLTPGTAAADLPPPVFVVQFQVDPAHEDAWNDWYTNVHLAEVMALSRGIRRATRYRQVGGTGTLPYLAAYEFDSADDMRQFLGSQPLAAASAEFDASPLAGISTRINHAYLPFVTTTRKDQP